MALVEGINKMLNIVVRLLSKKRSSEQQLPQDKDGYNQKN
jgi:hypothetical protein